MKKIFLFPPLSLRRSIVCMIVVRPYAAFQDIFLEWRRHFQNSPAALRRDIIPPSIFSIIIFPTTSYSATLASLASSASPIFAVPDPPSVGCDPRRQSPHNMYSPHHVSTVPSGKEHSRGVFPQGGQSKAWSPTPGNDVVVGSSFPCYPPPGKVQLREIWSWFP